MEIILGHLTTILQALHRLASLARTPLYTTLTWSLAYDIIHEADATIRIVDGNRGCRSLVLQIIKPLLEPLVPRPVVVVHRSTESIELETIALLYHIVVSILESVEATISIVESSSKVDTLDDSIAASGVNLEDITTIDKERLSGSHNAERQLLVHLHIASLSPRHIASQAELYVEEILTIRSYFADLERQTHNLLLARALYAAIGYERTLVDSLAVLDQSPRNLIVLQTGEVVLVEDLNGIVVKVSLNAYILIHLLDLKILWLRSEIRQDNTIHAEHAIVRPFAVVTAIAHKARTIRSISPNRLIHPVPDSAATEEVRTLDSVPIVLEVAHRVTHGVSIL